MARAIKTRGKYRLLPPDETSDGFCRLVHGRGKTEYFAGFVSNPENFETAIDAAEEEMRCLLEQARREFGA
jgi:hypothetical protein